MSLPAAWVDRIFDKMTLAYGREFLSRWEGQDLNAVKSDWGHEMQAFHNWPSAITYGLQNLPERAPNVVEFKRLCKQAPAPEGPVKIEADVKADPERIKKALEVLTHRPPVDFRDWARRLIERHESGDWISTPAALKMARDALKESRR
jgi:hypothetical protein